MMRMINKLIDALHVIGYSWIVIVGIYILLQYVRVLLTDGLPFAQRVFSFLNIWNLFFAFVALMPGLMCIMVSDYFFKKR